MACQNGRELKHIKRKYDGAVLNCKRKSHGQVPFELLDGLGLINFLRNVVNNEDTIH